MNARALQDAIVEDLNTLFKTRMFKLPGGGTAPLTFYPQNLPKRDADDDPDPVPYGIVRLDTGNIQSQTDAYKVGVIILIGIFDDDLRNQGHRAVLEVLELMQQHYEETPLLSGNFVFEDPFNWVLQDEESYPYFFGAANLVFKVPAPRRKWSDRV